MSPTLAQSFASWAQVAIAGAVLTGAVLIPLAIHQASRRTARQEAALRYLERHDRDSFAQLLSWARGVVTLRAGEGPDEGAERYRRLSDYQRDQLWRVLDFWEETSLVYINGLFDEGLFRGTLGPRLVEAWLENAWLIDHLRRTRDGGIDPRLFSTWERVCTRMLRARVRRRGRRDSGPVTEVVGVASARSDISSPPGASAGARRR